MRTGPKGGKKLTGPIALNTTIIHPCYTDFILANIARSGFVDNYSIPMEQRLEHWRRDYPFTCRSSCPGVQNSPSSHEQDMDDNSDDNFIPPAAIINVVRGQELRHTPRLRLAIPGFEPTTPSSNGTSATLSALAPNLLDRNVGTNLDLDFRGPAPFPNFLNNYSPSQSRRLLLPSSPTLIDTPQSPTRSFILPIAPDTHELNPYRGPISPAFNDFQEFELFVINCCQTVGSNFRVQAENVAKAAKGLVEAIKGVNRCHLVTFMDNGNSVISPAGLSLSQIFSCSNWMFFA